MGLVLLPMGAAQATNYRQSAALDPPGQVIVLPRDAAHCMGIPGVDTGDLGCFYVDVGGSPPIDEMTDFTDNIQDGKLIGVHWSTPNDGGVCFASRDEWGDGALVWCDLPDINEGTPITWRVGTCSRPLGVDCHGPDWTWGPSREVRA
jgi:hypothetical protein